MFFRVKKDLDGINKKLLGGNKERAKYAMANQMLLDMNRYVPLKDGGLRLTGTVNSKQLTWNTRYAKRQFYKPAQKYTTPGTGTRWDMRAKSKHSSDWGKVYARGLGLK